MVKISKYYLIKRSANKQVVAMIKTVPGLITKKSIFKPEIEFRTFLSILKIITMFYFTMIN